jgi:DNA mismatch repair protein MutL
MSNGLEATFGGDDFHYVANFHLPPDSIDVNVHPNKTIIKVMETSKMISLLTSTIKELGSKRQAPKESPIIPMIPESPVPAFFDQLGSSPALQQERHEYNMEGFFSPHNLPAQSTSNLIWVGSTFLKKNGDHWLAVSSQKLLEVFTRTKLKTPATSIPLMVSEPFPAKNVSRENILMMNEAGAELEYLGAETLVLRSIPDRIM